MDIPIGGIIEWAGAIIDIPVNFALCDGNNGTPDLTDRFVIGAGGALPVGNTGGVTSHTHGAGNLTDGPGAGVVEVWGAGETIPGNNIPPYYALAKIMRIA